MNNVHNQIQLTPDGLQSLQEELRELKEIKRPKVVEVVSNARDEGDLSENSAYISGKEELNFIDGRIAELEEILAQAKVVNVKTTTSDGIQIGHQVTLKVENNDKEHIFQIVGEWEADPKEKKISHNSPLGSALLGKKAGDKIEVEAPAGKILYKIIYIN